LWRSSLLPAVELFLILAYGLVGIKTLLAKVLTDYTLFELIGIKTMELEEEKRMMGVFWRGIHI